MTKNEIIEAINATIVTNGQKGITAESLANILLEMVNATPEGGSGAGVTINPVGFLVVGNGIVKFVAVGQPTAADKLVDYMPEAIEKIQGFFNKDGKKKEEKKYENKKGFSDERLAVIIDEAQQFLKPGVDFLLEFIKAQKSQGVYK